VGWITGGAKDGESAKDDDMFDAIDTFGTSDNED
jgi:hypothetical protein